MARQLKRWESPRREGRNDKGRGGAARKRQRQKQLKNLAKKLKQGEIDSPTNQHKFNTNQEKREGREQSVSSLFYLMLNQSGQCSAIGKDLSIICVGATETLTDCLRSGTRPRRSRIAFVQGRDRDGRTKENYNSIGNSIVARYGPCNRDLYKVDRYLAWSYLQRAYQKNSLRSLPLYNRC